MDTWSGLYDYIIPFSALNVRERPICSFFQKEIRSCWRLLSWHFQALLPTFIFFLNTNCFSLFEDSRNFIAPITVLFFLPEKIPSNKNWFPRVIPLKKVKPNIFVYFIQHLPNFPGQAGQFHPQENGQLKSLLSGRLHMSNWFFSAIMDGSGLCIPIRLKNEKPFLQIRGARSQVFSRQEKKSAVISHDDVVKSKWCQGFVDIFLWRQLPTHLISLLWIFIMGETFCHTSGLLFACINNIKTMTSFQTKFSGSSVIWSDNFSVSEALKKKNLKNFSRVNLFKIGRIYTIGKKDLLFGLLLWQRPLT